MNREKLVEKAALAVHGIEGCHIGCIAGREAGVHSLGRDDHEVGAAVVDVLLPQVTTVEELEALPNETALLYASDRGVTLLAWGPSDRGGEPTLWNGPYAIVASRIPDLLPLTVVWSPS